MIRRRTYVSRELLWEHILEMLLHKGTSDDNPAGIASMERFALKEPCMAVTRTHTYRHTDNRITKHAHTHHNNKNNNNAIIIINNNTNNNN